MALYRCYFRGLSGHFDARQDFHADSDEEATAKARVLYAELEVKAGFELWNGAQLIVAEAGVENKI
jgi:hypothetical protein